MVDLPQVPELDPNAKPSKAKPAKAKPTKKPAASVPKKSVSTKSTSPKPASTPPPPPEPDATPDDGSQNDAVQDSVEEVLEQSSAQALRLSHLQDSLDNLDQTLGDIRDEMHAGFAEVRAVAEGSPTAETNQPGEIAGLEQALVGRLDFVEEQSAQANRRASLIIGVAVVQMLLLAGLILLAFSMRTAGPKTELPPPYVAAPSEPGTVDEVDKRAEPVEDVKRPVRKRGRRRR